jgi:hypothetical protein
MGVFRTLALAAAVLVVCASQAHADVLVHDGGVSRDSDASALVRGRTGKVPELVMSSDVLAGPSRMLTVNASIERCEGGSIRLDPGRKLDKVVDQVLSFDLEAALGSLDVLDTLFPCAEAVIPRRVLAKMAFLRGAALLDLDRGDEAQQSMADALAFDPKYDGERGFPQPHLDLLKTQAAAPATSTRLAVWLGRTKGAVFVDGGEQESASTTGTAVRPGRHLVQVRTEAGTQGMWVRTGVKPATIVHPGAGRRIWADGGSSPGGASGMRMLLADEFGRDVDVHVLQFRGRKHHGVTFAAGEVGFVDWTGTPAAGGEGSSTKRTAPKRRTKREAPKKRTRARRPPTSGAATADDGEPRRVRIAVGGGYQYAMPFHYGVLAVDISGRPIGPLTVAAFVRPGYAGMAAYVDPTVGPVEGPVFLVPFGGAAGVQKPGAIAPYIRVGGQVALNRDGEDEDLFLGGIIVQGGIDLSPAGSPLLFRVQGEIGNLGAHLSTRFWAGVGVRF